MTRGRSHRGVEHARPAIAAAIALGFAVLGAAPAWAAAGGEHAYLSLYARMLEKHTRAVEETVGTRVDYAGLKADPTWPKVVEALGQVDPESIEGRRAKLAFWINAYNILTIDLVQKHWPLDSIKDIGSFFRPVWNREAGRIAGEPYSLDQIEHEIIRPMGEPRIHAAIVCASISCPDLRREPFVASRLSEQLDDSLRTFLGRSDKGMKLDRARDELSLSKIFDWFGEDFEPQGGVVAYLLPYFEADDREYIQARGGAIDIEYLPYDWNVNR